MSARDTILLDKLIISSFQRSISLIFIKKKMSQRVQNYILKHLSAILGFLIHVPPTISRSNWLSFRAKMGILQSDEAGIKISSIQLCRPQSAGDIRESHASWQCVHEAEQAVCSFTAIKPLQCWKMQLRGDTNKLLHQAISVALPGIDWDTSLQHRHSGKTSMEKKVIVPLNISSLSGRNAELQCVQSLGILTILTLKHYTSF